MDLSDENIEKIKAEKDAKWKQARLISLLANHDFKIDVKNGDVNAEFDPEFDPNVEVPESG